jgi:hypothetical protein
VTENSDAECDVAKDRDGFFVNFNFNSVISRIMLKAVLPIGM